MDQITYGGQIVKVTTLSRNQDKVLEYKGIKILLSQLKKFTEIPAFRSQRLIAGVDPHNRVPISKGHNGNIIIGCLEDTEENFYQLFKTLLDE